MNENKINLDCVWGFDSVTYRKALEFIKKEGIEPFEKLFADILKTGDLLNNAIMHGKHPTLGLTRNNKTVIEFLRQFDKYFLNNNQCYLSENFRKFIKDTSENIDKLNLYLENAQRLEELKVCHVSLQDLKDYWLLINHGMGRIQIFKEKNNIICIRKNYTDGRISYNTKRINIERDFEEYDVSISPNENIENSPTWLIQCENSNSGNQCRYAWIENYGFNAEYLPTCEELSAYEEPQTLKLYKEKIKS